MSLTVHLVLVFRFFIAVAVMVMVCGHRGLWPSWLWPSWYRSSQQDGNPLNWLQCAREIWCDSWPYWPHWAGITWPQKASSLYFCILFDDLTFRQLCPRELFIWCRCAQSPDEKWTPKINCCNATKTWLYEILNMQILKRVTESWSKETWQRHSLALRNITENIKFSTQ